MTKRKLTDFYKAIKKQGYAVQRESQRRRINNSDGMVSRASRRQANRRSRPMKRRKNGVLTRGRVGKAIYKRARRGRRVARRQRRAARAVMGVTWKEENLQTIVYDYADTCVVTPGASASLGKQCAYFSASGGSWNVSGSNASTATTKSLMGINHITDIAKTVATSTPSYGTTATLIETKFVIKDCYQTSTLINTSNFSCFITSYLCRVRRGHNVSAPNYFLGDGFLQRGFNFAGGSGVTNTGVTDASMSPYDSHKFCSFYQIITQKRQEMETGASLVFTKRCGRKTINTDYLYNQSVAAGSADFSATTYNRLPGEYFYFFKLEGIPANDSTTGTNMTYTSPKIDMITKFHYNYCALSPQVPLLQKVVQGYTLEAFASVAARNEVDGAKEIQTT